MDGPAEQRILEAIALRRAAGGDCDGAELHKRIEELGDMPLDRRARHNAFVEVYVALTPSGFQLRTWPDETSIGVAPATLRIKGVLVDEIEHGQAAAEIERTFVLDAGVVSHELLRVQRAYRGLGLSHVLLNQAFPFYRALQLRSVLVHAALETGRWQWARMGFDFEPDTFRPLMETWAMLCLAALGEPRLPAGFRANELALLGSEPSGRETSFESLHDALELEISRRLADPSTVAAMQEFLEYCDDRIKQEMGLDLLDANRLRRVAAANKLAYDENTAAGKIIMLAGPDWYGVFDLDDPATRSIFETEFERRFSVR
jgi:GNAT superfamily N-acetyltransferase